MRQAYDYWQDQPGYYQTNTTFNTTRVSKIGRQAKQNPTSWTLSIPIQKNQNIKCQAHECDWETNPMQATHKKQQCTKIHSRQGRVLGTPWKFHRTATKHSKPYSFPCINTHWVTHNQEFPFLTDISKTVRIEQTPAAPTSHSNSIELNGKSKH